MSRLLCELKECKISLRELSSECKSIKQLHKVQVAFLKGTNSISWEATTQKFPKYATAAQLEPFKKLNFSGPGLWNSSCGFASEPWPMARVISMLPSLV